MSSFYNPLLMCGDSLTCKAIIAICSVVVIIIIVSILMATYAKKRLDHMTNVLSTQNIGSAIGSHATELKDEDIKIKPTFFDAGSGTIMSGTDFIPTKYLSLWYQAYTGNLKNYDLLDDGEGGAAGLQYNQCSKSCCSPQYPLPFDMPVDESVCMNNDNFVPTNYTCNNAWQDSGCVCMTKHQADFLSDRGNNI